MKGVEEPKGITPKQLDSLTWGSEAIKWQVTIPENKCLYTSKDSEYVQLSVLIFIDKAQYIYYLFDR